MRNLEIFEPGKTFFGHNFRSYFTSTQEPNLLRRLRGIKDPITTVNMSDENLATQRAIYFSFQALKIQENLTPDQKKMLKAVDAGICNYKIKGNLEAYLFLTWLRNTNLGTSRKDLDNL